MARRSAILVAIIAIVASCNGVVLEGTNADAEYLSAITKDIANERNSAGQAVVSISQSRQATDGTANATTASAAAASAIASQVSSALSQFDLGLGYYKMCPFPFSYLHQCEGSSDCPGSDCCGMYAFPGPNRWRRSCCVPESVTTIARVASLCIKSPEKPGE